LAKKRLIGIFCIVFLLGAWSWFCFVKIPVYQEEQFAKENDKLITYIRESNQDKYYMTDIPITEEQAQLIQTEVTELAEVEPEVIPEITYAEEDLALLARLIQSEGGIESYTCKLYIGSVVLNRVSRWDSSIHTIIYDTKPTVQFSVTIKKNGSAPIDCIPNEESLAAAKELLINGTQLPPDVMVFYSESCDDGWVTSRKTYTKVDHTIFAYSNK